VTAVLPRPVSAVDLAVESKPFVLRCPRCRTPLGSLLADCAAPACVSADLDVEKAWEHAADWEA
jgi:Zn finger protein HypA/HybF involved in hydrogenase expression